MTIRAVDTFDGRAPEEFLTPASGAVQVFPSDTDELEIVSRAIYVGADADLNVILMGNFGERSEATILKNVPQGTILPLRVAQILETGSTPDTPIVAMW